MGFIVPVGKTVHIGKRRIREGSTVPAHAISEKSSYYLDPAGDEPKAATAVAPKVARRRGSNKSKPEAEG